MKELNEMELKQVHGGLSGGDAISVGGIAVGVSLAVLLFSGVGAPLAIAAGILGVVGDGYIAYGISKSN
jgi:hypothetical protein